VDNLEKKLNKNQLEAVRYLRGPLLIIAGAGTGKTTVITEKVKYLIQKGMAKPSEILALTFTEKAAKEMQDRVDLALPYGYVEMWISTFHSFCDKILRMECFNIGLDPSFKLMTQAESVQFIRDNLFEFELEYFMPLGNPTKFISELLQHFSRLKDEDIDPDTYLAWVKSKDKKNLKEDERLDIVKYKELALAYKKYEELKAIKGFMDFGDLIVNTLKLFRKRPNILSEYKKVFKYILVDEFQDTNIAQYELLKLLAPPNKNPKLTVVGDDSQSIYKFRGAAVSNILYFKKDYKTAKTVILTQNYRSGQKILDCAYRLIQYNNPDTLEVKLGVSKNLSSLRDINGEVFFIHEDRVENEAEAVAREVKKLVLDEKKYRFKDIAVLVRANNHSESFLRAFSRYGIPYQFLGPGRLFKQPEIVDLISYLKVLYNVDDSVSFFRLLSADFFDLDPKDLVRIANFAKARSLSLFQALEELDDIFISNATRAKLGRIKEIIESHLKLIKKETAGQILYYFLRDSEILTKLLNPDSPSAERKAANISKFFDQLKTYEIDHEDATVFKVVDWLDLASEFGESPLAAEVDWDEVNAVNILTVHSAKGLEFPVVFLVNLVSQRFPTSERREKIPIPDELIKEVLPEGDYHIQEERRLFYVGMTRAEDLLYLTAADYYGEGKREKRLSPFIFEALGEESILQEKKIQSTQLSFLDYQPKSAQEEVKGKSLLHIDFLTYSQIETFETCPLHYKLEYIVKIPKPPSASRSFGSSIHETLKEFYQRVKRGEKASEKLILEILQRKWRSIGFMGKVHERKFFEKAKIYLTGFLREGFDPKILPYSLEQKFTLNLPKMEGERPLKIGGVIDRIDILPDGKIEIIDYKTGATIPTKEEVAKNFQLTFYALAANLIREGPFNKNPDEIFLSLYFLDTQEKFTTVRSKAELKMAVEKIYRVRKEIENSDFECSAGKLCENCEFSIFCKRF